MKAYIVLAASLVALAVMPVMAEGTFYVTVMPVAVNEEAKEFVSSSQKEMLQNQIYSALAAQGNYVVLSRKLLGRIIEERQLTVAEADSLNKFKAAGVIISPVILCSADKHLIFEIEAIAAQNAQLLSRQTFKINPNSDWQQEVQQAVEEICHKIPPIAKSLNSQTLTEATVDIAGDMPYCFWRVGVLDMELRRSVSKIPGMLCIQPRKPAIIQEERLLRAVGMTQADKVGQNFVTLKPTADCRVNIAIKELPLKTGNVNDVVIEANVKVQANGNILERKFTGKAGEFAEFQTKVLEFVADSINTLRENGSLKKASLSQSQQNDLAVKMAAEEMKSIDYLVGKRRGRYLGEPSEMASQKAIVAARALRAWNLDPLNEQAAFWACYYHRFLYPRQKDHPGRFVPEANEATARLADKYLECFWEKEPLHYYNLCLLRSSVRSASDKPCRFDGKCCVWELKNMPFARSNEHISFMKGISHHFLLVPSNKLNEEFAYWKNFYETEYLPAYKIMKKKGYRPWGGLFRGDWQQVEAVYYARMRQPVKVRELLQSLADRYFESDLTLWEPKSSLSISSLLRMAGDKQWKTWRPKFVERPADLESSLGAYTMRNNPQPPYDPTPYMPPPIKLPVSKVRYVIDGNINSDQRGIQLLGIIDDKAMLFMSPYVSMKENRSRDVRIYIADRKKIKRQFGRDEVTVELAEIPLPEYPIPEKRTKGDMHHHPYYELMDYLAERDANGNLVLWLATKCHGLTKLVQDKDGKFSGRWFTVRDGLRESTSIKGLERAKYDGKSGLLTICCPDSKNSDSYQLYFFDPENISWTLLGNYKNTARLDFKNGQYTYIGFGDSHRLCSVPSMHNLKPSALITSKKVLSDNDLKGVTIRTANTGRGQSILPDKHRDILYILWDGIGMYSKGRRNSLMPCMDECLRRLCAVRNLPGWAGLQGFSRITAPVGYIQGMVPMDEYFCIAMYFTPDHPQFRKDKIFLWQPAKSGNPADGDSWMGPFTWDGHDQIDSITADPDGWLWLGGWQAQGVWLINMREAEKLAKQRSQVWTSQQWREMYESGLKKYWRLWAKYLVGQGKPQKAIEVLDRIISAAKNMKDKTLLTDAMMLKAAILSNNKADIPAALEIFHEVLELNDDLAVQYLAKKNLGLLYYKTGNYEQTVKYLSQIPDHVELRYDKVGKNYKYFYLVHQRIGWCLSDARKKAAKNKK